MKTKKIVSIILLIVLLMSQLSLIPFNNIVYAQKRQITNNTGFRFHYNQLVEKTDEKSKMAVKLYDVMYEMYINGELKTGTASRDIAQEGIITQEELKNYVKGNKALTNGMNAARYAFYADYPEIFYVDFSHLSLRITSSANGYHAILGSGKYESYYVDGFNNESEVNTAIEQLNTIVEEIVEEANKKDDEVEKIKYVHNEIINKVSYRYEDECYNGNQGFLGTPYGTLVKRQSVCEGYSRAFKMIMDKLGITCILVQGVHQYSGEIGVEHMWNYVKIEGKERNSSGKWYAVDCTQDDPSLTINKDMEQEYYTKFKNNIIGGENYGLDGLENQKYLLVGGITMRQRHFEDSVIAAAGDYEFEYPVLEEENFLATVTENTDGFKITTETYEDKSTYGDEKITALKVTFSYKGMSVEKAQEQGLYIVARWLDSEEQDDMRWGYLVPEGMAFGNSEDETFSTFVTGPSKYIQFAVTDKKYVLKGNLDDLIYKGNEKDLIAVSERIYNPYHEYQPAPYIIKQSPVQTDSITIRKAPYKVSATWDDKVVRKYGEELRARINCNSTLGAATTGAQKSKIENIEFDEATNTVTFDFTFSEMWADDSINYIIYIEGLEGKDSKKAPNPIVLSGKNYTACAPSQAKRGVWELYAKPTLIENDDLSMKNWVTSNGQGVSELLRNRIALVTTKTTKKEQQQIDEKISEKLSKEKIVKSETYNIALTICKKNIKKIENGHKVTMKVGFPEGCGPESAGVTYKAYHFSKDESGNVIGIDELDCVVTQYGLIITCNAFSPFTIVAVKTDETVTPVTKKSLIATAEEDGRVSAKLNNAENSTGNLLSLEEGQTATIDIIPDTGYQIDTVSVCGEMIDLNKEKNTTSDTKQITVDYDKIKDGNSIVHATFVAKQIAQEEKEEGHSVVTVEPDRAEIKMPTQKTIGLNSKLTITPEVSETTGIQTYQWYKGETKLEGKTNKVLQINNVSKEDSGEYTLEVTSTLDTVSAITKSTPCTVTISKFETTITKTTQNKLYAGQEFEVTVNIHDFENIPKGLIALGGQLEYDTNILERISITEQNGWDMEGAFNDSGFKFVMDNDNYIIENSDIFKIKFRVKDSVKQEVNTAIKIKEIVASNAGRDIGSKDAELSVNIEEVPDVITSNTYVIGNEFISRIVPKTTVGAFKTKVEASKDIVIKDKEGNILNDQDIIKTGATLQIGNTLNRTLVVTGDLDGNGEITITDLAQLKLHYIGKETLTGASLKAADLDGNNEITITDLAQIKLVCIGKLTLE